MGDVRFAIVFSEEAVENLKTLPTSAISLIKKAIEERLKTDPISYGKPLRFSLKGLRRLRVSKYRVIYEVIIKDKTVYIVNIDFRRDVYD